MLKLVRSLLRRLRRRRLPPGAVEPPEAGSVQALRVGDVVNHDGSDFIVEGTLRFVEGGFRWEEHLLVDGVRRLWLSVEEDEGGLEVVEWERRPAAGIEPGPDRLEYEGVTYVLQERGTADYTSEGKTGAPASGRAEYADYTADDRRLGFERYSTGGSWEVATGRPLSPHLLDIYPAGRPRS